jgi:DNA helicase-2/ATP-dependent DNA helicase PcrA
MDYASLLNEKQLAAVKTPSQYVRIIAGAGSGKTRVLTYRISYLISEKHVDPSRILAIAFTNKVATEMHDRASEIGEDVLGYTPNLHISTFHSFLRPVFTGGMQGDQLSRQASRFTMRTTSKN